ncbi:MAG: (2Fe-2S)-binding protein [Planctomycetaceae bacterium]|nr:(2Fe-2S)-binding protein [Planctomycetales bacterium]MCB9923313.1 (2Fe-2S)-binding protein [Planctomycetaceae bacterium]
MTDLKNKAAQKSGFNRRDFFRGSGAIAAATALQTQSADAFQDQSPQVISGETTITLNVNGKDHSVKAEPRTTLLEVLRYQLDLTGAKPVSSDGSSGASTIFVDGKPMTASTILALQAVGKKIETVESLGGDAVQRAFVKHDAEQCGFCTPGFVMAVRSLLNKKPNASEAEIRSGLNGNICRCGTYANIVDAAISVAKGGN